MVGIIVQRRTVIRRSLEWLDWIQFILYRSSQISIYY